MNSQTGLAHTDRQTVSVADRQARSRPQPRSPLEVIVDGLRPRGPVLTPLNALIGIILAVGLVLTVRRFGWGLAATTNLTDNYPWGFWIGFDVLTGVALAAGGYTIGAAVHVFNLRAYAPIVRPAILTGFLGYVFVIVGLLFDLGRPWRLPYPMIMSYGVTSVLFLVGWHFALYLTAQMVEVAPALFEWLGLRRMRTITVKMTLAVTIFGVVLAVLHQAALGGLFLLAPWKLHPLWYSPYLPVFFFVSSVYAGLAMVIVESSLSQRYLGHLMDEDHRKGHERIVLGLGKGAALTMFLYLGIKVAGIMYDNRWGLLFEGFYGPWFLVEMLGFVALPCAMFAAGYRNRRVGLVRAAAVLAVLGILLNRLNVSIIAFNYHLPAEQRYVPSWMEFWISLAIVTFGIVCFRWIVARWPIFWRHPDFEPEH